jgi:hypothetical protein
MTPPLAWVSYFLTSLLIPHGLSQSGSELRKARFKVIASATSHIFHVQSVTFAALVKTNTRKLISETDLVDECGVSCMG